MDDIGKFFDNYGKATQAAWGLLGDAFKNVTGNWFEHGSPSKDTVIDYATWDKNLEKIGWTREQAKEYWNNPKNNDPYSVTSGKIDEMVEKQVPKVSVSGNKLVISAPQEVLDSPYVKQLNDELQTLKGVDLKSPEVANIIDALNQEMKTNAKTSMVESTFGWSKDEYEDYQRLLQEVSASNPMKSTQTFKWKKDGDFIKDEKGKIAMLTPQQWVDYWKSYNVDDRTDLLEKSAKSQDPYERTMALIMLQGNDAPVTGYDWWERVGQGLGAFGNQMMKFPEGTMSLLFESPEEKFHDMLFDKLTTSLGRKNVSKTLLTDRSINTEEKFNEKKQRILDILTKVKENPKANAPLIANLSDEDLAFITMSSHLKDIMLETLGSPAEGATSPEWTADLLYRIIEKGDYDAYKAARNGLDTWHEYEDINDENDKRLAKNAIWSGGEQLTGNITGVIGRFLWEAAVIRGLTGGISASSITNPHLLPSATTGGFNVTGVSDVIGDKIVSGLGKIGISPASTAGQSALRFTANLLGTVPEDILQTSIDNVVTGNAEENAHLLDPEQMSENFIQNLAWMSIFNAGRAGISTFKRIKMAKNMAKAAELNKPLTIVADSDDIRRAIDKGNEIKIDGDKVSVVDENGNSKVLEGTTPDNVRIAQQASLFDYADDLRRAAEEGGDTPKVDTEKVEKIKAEAVADDAAKVADNVDTISTKTGDNSPVIKRAMETADGTVLADTPDYRFKNYSEALNSRPRNNQASVDLWHSRAKAAYAKDFGDFLTEFKAKFGNDIDTSDFDWVLLNTKKGLSPEKIIGTVNPENGRVVTKNMIEAMKWWGDQPIIKDLRKESIRVLGKNFQGGDFNRLGYLPHTSYDPSVVSPEEARKGILWREFTGKSLVDENGDFKSFGGTFEDRFNTYTSNLLWDVSSEQVAAAKLIDEAIMDGQEYTPELENATKEAVTAEKAIDKGVDNASSTKAMNKFMLSDVPVDENSAADIRKMHSESVKEANKSKLGETYHEKLGDVFKGKNSGSVVKQPGKFAAKLDVLSNNLKRLVIRVGGTKYDFYHYGAADIVYAPQNATFVAKQFINPDGTINASKMRTSFADFIESHSHRQRKYAEMVADKWVARIGKIEGPLTEASITSELTKAMRSEAWSRAKKWLVMADYKSFDEPARKTIDNFLFNQMQTEAIANNTKIINKMTKVMNGLTELRYDALFYGNFKNAVLQLSEVSRTLTVFKLGDLAQLTKKMATDPEFRAEVDLYYDVVAPREKGMRGLDDNAYKSYSAVANGMTIEEDGVSLKKLKATGKKAKDAIDGVALLPIESAEAFKNRVFVAAIVQEASSNPKLTDGNMKLDYIRNKFERVALAGNEMGKIGMATNPLSRTLLFLQNFQMRELGMHCWILKDINELENVSKPMKRAKQAGYLTKVLGTKLGNTLMLTSLGYTPAQTIGIDPLGLGDRYTGLSEDETNWLDEQISHGALTPLVAGGMTSLLADLYFMFRRAYEDSAARDEYGKVTEEGEGSFGGAFRLPAAEEIGTKAAESFIPGALAAKRFNQMNEMMDTGWATSAAGNKMYTAPTDPLDIIKGYLFGRSATENAREYSQLSGDDIGQTLSRLIRKPIQDLIGQFTGEEYDSFDPIDAKNYTDWFKGDANDIQRFNKGRWHFIREKNRIIKYYKDNYEEASREDKAEIANDMNQELEKLSDQIGRFVDAYEAKNGPINSKMVNQVLNMLEVESPILGDYGDNSGWGAWDHAKEEYARLGLSPVGTYSQDKDTGETKYQGSPQFSNAKSGYYDVDDELVGILEKIDAQELAPLRKELQSQIDYGYTAGKAGNWGPLTETQNKYLRAFDNAVAPVVAIYGIDAFKKNGIVEDQLKKMLNSGSLIPSSHYSKNKWGRNQSMPLQEVDVGKWFQQRYSNDKYKKPIVTSNTTAEEDISEIKRLVKENKPGLARAKAIALQVRIENKTRALPKEQREWLTKFIEEGSK